MFSGRGEEEGRGGGVHCSAFPLLGAFPIPGGEGNTEMQTSYRNTEIQGGNTEKKEREGAVCRFSITGGPSNTGERGVYCCLCRKEID